MKDLYEKSLSDPSIQEEYGEQFLYLCEIALFFKNVMRSCFSLKRNKNNQTSNFVYPESQLRMIIGEFYSISRSSIEPYSETLEVYQVDLAQLIVCLRESYSLYKLRLTITFHLLYHICDIMFKYYTSDIGMGVLSCSEFEKTHTRYKQKINDHLAKDMESNAYRNSLFHMTNAFNSV